MADWHTSRRGSHLLLPTLSLPALPMHFFLPGWQQPFSTLTCLSSCKIKLSYVQRLHLLLLSGDSGGIQNPELHPLCLPASAAASLLLSCCTKCSQGRALWILQQPLPTINHCQQLTTADITITGTLQQGCVQVFQRGSHTPPKRDTAACASGECINRRDRTAAPSKSYPQAAQVRILAEPLTLQLWSSQTLQAGQGWAILTKSFTHWHKMQ